MGSGGTSIRRIVASSMLVVVFAALLPITLTQPIFPSTQEVAKVVWVRTLDVGGGKRTVFRTGWPPPLRSVVILANASSDTGYHEFAAANLSIIAPDGWTLVAENLSMEVVEYGGSAWGGAGWLLFGYNWSYDSSCTPGTYTIIVNVTTVSGEWYGGTAYFDIAEGGDSYEFTITIECEEAKAGWLKAEPGSATVIANATHQLGYLAVLTLDLEILNGSWVVASTQRGGASCGSPGWIAVVALWNYSELEEGLCRLEASASDGARKVSTFAEVGIDRTPPIIRIIQPHSYDVIIDQEFTVVWLVEDAQSGYKSADVYLNGTHILSTQYTNATVQVNQSSVYCLEVVGYDVAGNEARGRTYFTVDLAWPRIVSAQVVEGDHVYVKFGEAAAVHLEVVVESPEGSEDLRIAYAELWKNNETYISKSALTIAEDQGGRFLLSGELEVVDPGNYTIRVVVSDGVLGDRRCITVVVERTGWQAVTVIAAAILCGAAVLALVMLLLKKRLRSPEGRGP